MFLVLKALHIIFSVTWFAALFYLPRLFIYQTEAQVKEENERSILTRQFKVMSKRLWFGIGWPSLVLNLIFGLGILHIYFEYMPWWLIVKLVMIAILIAYHHFLHFVFKSLQNDVYKYSSDQLRLINEVATILLFGIVILGVTKGSVSFQYIASGLVALAIAVYIGFKVYKNKRS